MSMKEIDSENTTEADAARVYTNKQKKNDFLKFSKRGENERSTFLCLTIKDQDKADNGSVRIQSALCRVAFEQKGCDSKITVMKIQ